MSTLEESAISLELSSHVAVPLASKCTGSIHDSWSSKLICISRDIQTVLSSAASGATSGATSGTSATNSSIKGATSAASAAVC